MIWCVEDDASIRDIELYALNSAGFATKGFDDGLAFWEALKKEQPQLVLLDVMLPGMDGFEICKKIREDKNIPIIMVSAKKDDIDKIRGLGLGADDYVTKPFNPLELVARVRSQIRRYVSLGSLVQTENMYVTGGLTLNTDTKEVTVDGEGVKLTAREYSIL